MNKKNGLVSGDMMQKQQFDTKTLRRLLSYMKDYKGQLIFVVVCILLSAIASAVSALFLQSLIDDYIAPLLTSSAPVSVCTGDVLRSPPRRSLCQHPRSGWRF